MPTRGAEQSPSLVAAAKQVTEHAGTLAKLKLELLRLELKTKAVAVAFGVTAAVLALYGLGFLFATVVVALAIVLDTWLALLLVTLGLFAVAGVLGLLARSRLRSGTATARDNGHG
ncbi:MAG TPA: phage holin family protein [Gaiellaceae bacterium]|nr:phage holin family protein [Gaiellaceae bacterium]